MLTHAPHQGQGPQLRKDFSSLGEMRQHPLVARFRDRVMRPYRIGLGEDGPQDQTRGPVAEFLSRRLPADQEVENIGEEPLRDADVGQGDETAEVGKGGELAQERRLGFGDVEPGACAAEEAAFGVCHCDGRIGFIGIGGVVFRGRKRPATTEAAGGGKGADIADAQDELTDVVELGQGMDLGENGGFDGNWMGGHGDDG